MPIRLHEIHPTLAHFPVALLPTAVGADLAGVLLDDASLNDVGQKLMPVAAASMAITGVAGFVAQEAVRTDDGAHDLLITHRNLNVGLLALTTVLATVRAGRRRPGPGYLLAGLAAAALATYTGYLGGHMVYAHGVGVKPGEGFDEARSPEIFQGRPETTARIAGENAGHAVKHAVHHLREGNVAPALRG